MSNRLVTGLALIALIVASILFLWKPWNPSEPSLKLGLDLQGGLRVTLVSDTPNPSPEDLATARNIVENRVNQFGVSEALVATAGNDKVVVELPGLTSADQERALDLIGQQAVLEFRIVKSEFNALPTEALTLDDLDPVAFTGEIVQTASAQFQQSPGTPSGPVVTFEIRPGDAQAFGNFTASNVGRRMAIVLDDRIITAPTLQSRISDSGQITGVGTLDEATDIAVVLRSGSLPISLKVDEVRSIGPTLGRDSINKGATAAIVGSILVILAVLMYYGPLFGGVLSFGVILAMLFIFGVLAALGAALTLPGLAGLVLTIGAAVDGNVISFERIREELREGRGLKSAMKRGFSNSLSAIIDANITTLLAALALYQYTTGPVRGFAITLAVGVVASVFVNIVVVPYVLGLLTDKNQRTYMWSGWEVRGLRLVERARPFVFTTGALAVAAIIYVSITGLSLSTDFTGGSNAILDVPTSVTTSQVRAAIDDLGIPGVTGDGATVVESSEGGTALTRQVSVRVGLGDSAQEATDEFASDLAAAVGGTKLSSDFVGPSVGADLRRGAILAVVVALLLVLVYLAFRFWPNWVVALAVVLASAHDVAITLGVQALLGIEFSIPVLAALLFVIGYSLNDSIIIADRIRENVRVIRDKPYRELVNLAVNQTLTRTVATSGTTLLPVLALLVFGGSVLRGFSVTLLVGIVIGTFSSIFLLAPTIVWVREWQQKRIENNRGTSRGKRTAKA
ncbi:MAG TPA: protein translocase subunit SecD [Trueperaceae bacterium]|nr:protein translocase subunit SecD [Trueperaceae bacterium]HRP48155.1 protein translocase subunit SecD [Trueperaceae bacterium]